MPVSPGWTWILEVFPEPVGEFRILTQQGKLLETNPRFTVGKLTDSTTSISNEIVATEGQTINVRARVLDQTGLVIEESTFPGHTWTHAAEWALSGATSTAVLDPAVGDLIQKIYDAVYRTFTV